jgi:RNA-directed DNA polymerase
MHGGIPRRSIFSHARAHVGRQMVFTLDVAGFFPSTSARHVQPVLSTIGIGGQAAEDIKSLIMLDNGLPQGAPTSSVFANLAFAPADTLFFEFCRRQLLFYTRYVDDIAISGDRAFTELKGTFIQFIESSGYSIAARDKINPMLSARRQIVTGLVVNDKLRPTREFLADLKHEIRLCLDHGAEAIAVSHGLTILKLKERLTGQACFVQQIDPKVGKKLRGMLCGVDWRNGKLASVVSLP